MEGTSRGAEASKFEGICWIEKRFTGRPWTDSCVLGVSVGVSMVV